MIDKRTLFLMDNNPAHAEVFREALLSPDDGPFEGEFVTTLSQGLERLHKKGIWAIFANLSLPDSQGLDTLSKLLHAAPGVHALGLCDAEQGRIAVEAMRRGEKTNYWKVISTRTRLPVPFATWQSAGWRKQYRSQKRIAPQ